ncbi:MAG: hypothetical protein SGJ01_02500 [Gemmatimonadota bacterium]|nr:hypothetical protein [Gemmatimonadota bacterium]
MVFTWMSIGTTVVMPPALAVKLASPTLRPCTTTLGQAKVFTSAEPYWNCTAAGSAEVQWIVAEGRGLLRAS